MLTGIHAPNAAPPAGKVAQGINSVPSDCWAAPSSANVPQTQRRLVEARAPPSRFTEAQPHRLPGSLLGAVLLVSSVVVVGVHADRQRVG